MVKRRKIIRHGKSVEKVVLKRKPVEEEDLEDVEDADEELDEELDDEELDEEDADEEPEEEEEEESAPRRVSRRVVAEEVSDEDEPEPVKVKKAPIAKPAKAAAPAAEIKTVDTVVAENVFTQLLASLEDGKSIIITHLKGNKYQLTLGSAVKAAGRKMSQKEYWEEVISPEARAWAEKWNKMTFEQRKAYAKKIGAKYEPHSDPRIEAMAITQAVRQKEGVEKYKPEYRTRAARAALKTGGL